MTMGSTGAGAGLGGMAIPGAAIGGMLGYAGAELVVTEKTKKDIVTNITEEGAQALVDGKIMYIVLVLKNFKQTIQNL